MDENQGQATGKRKKLARRLLAVVAALVVLAAFFPTIVAETPLRNLVLNLILDEEELRATVGAASCGWFSPLSVQRVNVVGTDKRFRLDVERVRAKKSWLQLLWTLPDIGTIEIDNPRIDLVVAELTTRAEPEVVDDDPQPVDEVLPEKHQPTLAAEIRNAALRIHSLENDGPIVYIQGLDLGLTIQRRDQGRFLSVRPGRILEHQPLTPELCAQGLHWVAPVLAGSTRVEGEVSIELKKFSTLLNVDGAHELQAEGVVRLHHVTSQLENPILQVIADYVSKLLKVDSPGTIRVVDNTEVEFLVQDGRVAHRGLAFVLPEFSDEVVLRSSGTVGFDESLDLIVQVSLPSTNLKQIPFIGDLTARPLELRITGTLDDPHWTLADERDLVEELADRVLTEEQKAGRPKPLANAIGDLIDGLANDPDRAAENLPTDIIQVIRAANEARKKHDQRRDKPR